MGERGPSPELESNKRLLFTGYYQKKMANVCWVEEPDRILVEVRLDKSVGQYGGAPVEVFICENEAKAKEALDKIRKGRHWEEMN